MTILAGVACGPRAGAGDAEVDASESRDGSAATSDAGLEADGGGTDAAALEPPTCSGFSTDGIPILSGEVIVGSPPPPSGGGPLGDGRYLLTTYSVYAPEPEPAPINVAGALEVSGGGQYARFWNNLTGVQAHDVSYSSTEMAFESICPTSGQLFAQPYSYDGVTVHLYQSLGGGRTVRSTYER